MLLWGHKRECQAEGKATISSMNEADKGKSVPYDRERKSGVGVDVSSYRYMSRTASSQSSALEGDSEIGYLCSLLEIKTRRGHEQ
ncbi:MAG: hypothetical protein JRF69_09890 [Deltaproteobacteria bacterium]|nr:hypothetical protein [Deltaproteobacteria bacterium]